MFKIGTYLPTYLSLYLFYALTVDRYIITIGTYLLVITFVQYNEC